jgi:hypothetical protein
MSARLVAVVLLMWAAAAALGWRYIQPPKPLVAATRSADEWVASSLFEPPLEKARTINLQAKPWGLERDGRPAVAALAPVSAASAPPSWVQWYLQAVVVRPKERYIVISTANAAAITVAEGATLPDGVLLAKVEQHQLTLIPPKAAKATKGAKAANQAARVVEVNF